MKPIFYKIKHSIGYSASRLLKGNISHLIIFVIIYLLGYITGIFTAAKYAKDLTTENLINTYLYSVLTKDMATITYFLVLTVYFVLIVLIFSLLTRNKIMLILDGIILFILSYIAGFDICVIFITLGFAGIVLGFITYGIIGLLFFTNLCLILSISATAINCRKKGILVGKDIAKTYTALAAIGAIYLFLIAVLFSIIHIFVIVG